MDHFSILLLQVMQTQSLSEINYLVHQKRQMIIIFTLFITVVMTMDIPEIVSQIPIQRYILILSRILLLTLFVSSIAKT